MEPALPIRRVAPVRVSILIAIGFALVTATWGGLQRIGWDIDPIFRELPGIHGPLMVCGFVGALFSLDHVISLNKKGAEIVPLLILLGSLLLFIRPVGPVGPTFVLLGSLGFCVISWIAHRQQPNLFNFMIFLGSLHWIIGIIIWFRLWPVFNMYAWWMGFVLFSLVGERLELSQRMKAEPTPLWALKIFLGVVILGEVAMAIGHLSEPDAMMEIVGDAIRDPRPLMGMRVTGIGMLATSLWLLVYDAAWPLLRTKGFARYSALCLISGYVWLGICGILSIFFAGYVSSFRYDALIHAFFLGFLWFVIFGHGPVILISNLGLRVPSSQVLLVPVFLLHASLAVRVAADVSRNFHLKMMGGLFNSLSLLAFFICLAYALIPSIKKRTPAPEAAHG